MRPIRFAQDFGSVLPLRSRPLSASTYRFSICFLVSDPDFVPISLSSLFGESKNVKERFDPPLEAGARFAATIWD
jgi:hypothetical protein